MIAATAAVALNAGLRHWRGRLVTAFSSLAAIMPPWRGKSTYPSCSDFPNHLLLHPGLAKVYALKVSKLHEALDDPTCRAEASDALRGLVHRIVVTPNAGDTGSTAML